jgi:hypothetical protein
VARAAAADVLTKLKAATRPAAGGGKSFRYRTPGARMGVRGEEVRAADVHGQGRAPWLQASQACQELPGRLDAIAAAACVRLGSDPHRPGVIDAIAVRLLFESVRLTDSIG